MKPTIGRVVHYKSKMNPYVMPAIITATKETLWKEGVERGDVPDITDKNNVHLTCFTAGAAVTYQEFDVSMATGPHDAEPGQWWWPERV